MPPVLRMRSNPHGNRTGIEDGHKDILLREVGDLFRLQNEAIELLQQCKSQKHQFFRWKDMLLSLCIGTRLTEAATIMTLWYTLVYLSGIA